MFFFFKQKTAYEMRISDWSSDVCSSDLENVRAWLYTRLVLQDIGQRYRVRLSVCVAMALAVNVILAVALTLRLLVNYNDAEVLQRDPALYVTVFDVVDRKSVV